MRRDQTTHVSRISDEYRELAIEELNVLTNIGAALRHGLLTVSAMLVRGKPVKGAGSKQTIIDMLSEE